MTVDTFNVAKVPPQAIGEAMATKRERTERDLLISMCQLLEENLAELKHLRAAVGMSSDSRSSVEITVDSKATVKPTVKVYADSDPTAACGLAQTLFDDLIIKYGPKTP